ncbi:MAG: hypothetical protein ACK5RN_14700, partial [bacterium]
MDQAQRPIPLEHPHQVRLDRSSGHLGENLIRLRPPNAFIDDDLDRAGDQAPGPHRLVSAGPVGSREIELVISVEHQIRPGARQVKMGPAEDPLQSHPAGVDTDQLIEAAVVEEAQAIV